MEQRFMDLMVEVACASIIECNRGISYDRFVVNSKEGIISMLTDSGRVLKLQWDTVTDIVINDTGFSLVSHKYGKMEFEVRV